MAGLNSFGPDGEIDQMYFEIVGAFMGLDDNDSLEFSAALIVILANRIGDQQVVRESIAAAKQAVEDKVRRSRPDGH